MEMLASFGHYLSWIVPPLVVLAATAFVFRPGSREVYRQKARLPFQDEQIHRRTLRRTTRRF